jgi:hypothetical protein
MAEIIKSFISLPSPLWKAFESQVFNYSEYEGNYPKEILSHVSESQAKILSY